MKKTVFYFGFIFGIVGISGCVTKAPEYVPLPPVAPIITPIDSALTSVCKSPVRIPSKDLSQKEIETYWSIDRKNLVNCRDKMRALDDAIFYRDNAITNNNKKKK